MLRRLPLAFVGLASVASAEPRARVTPDLRDSGPPTGSVCSTGEMRCLAHVVIDDNARIAPQANTGLTPSDIRLAYRINPNISTTPTVAIVVAFGYSNLESDLATYRSRFGLPLCTRANGCLEVINQDGAPSPLPADPPEDNDWTLETALDMDAVSAACPRCKILVVLANSPSGHDLYTAQATAASRRPAAISDSWGGSEPLNIAYTETFFDHPGIGQFVAAGDSGFNRGGAGPLYPSTSAHVIAVGGTTLRRTPNIRGWSETVWSDGGSSCSVSIPKPAHQPATPCAKRVTTEIAAVGDPSTGFAIYNSANGGWLVMGGTSVGAPLVAAMFASAGHGASTPADIAERSDVLFDVTSGANGDCGSILCTAGQGWDGPTGYGTPDTSALAGVPFNPMPDLRVAITSPGDGSTVPPDFEIRVNASGAMVVGALVDGDLVGKALAPPYVFAAPHMPDGEYRIDVFAVDAESRQVSASVSINVAQNANDGIDNYLGCSAPRTGSPLVALALLWLFRQRKSRSRGTVTVAPSST